MRPSASPVGADVGGTFTDLVAVRDGELVVRKVPSNPSVPGSGLEEGLRQLRTEAFSRLVLLHGTTVGTNAFLERKGHRTVLVTTAGFEDMLVIGRQTREHLYRLAQPPVEPLVATRDVFGLSERVLHDGSVLTPLTDTELSRLDRWLAERGDVSVAVSLLFAYAHPAHELAVSARHPQASVSSHVLPEYREYERTVATVLNASLRPVMARYLRGLQSGLQRLGVEGFWIMQSNGGLVSAEEAERDAVRTLVSGPAAGVEGAFAIASRAGYRNVMTLDVGGTSSDVSLCPGQVMRTREARLDNLPLAFPMVDIHTVGAGGGSLVQVDAGGALHVGPRSAGANPGPACYGRGEQATVTDAHLVLGRLGPHDLLGGAMSISVERARQAFEPVAAAARCTVEQAALGVVTVANASMEKALRVISVERGHDPRLFTLVAFGGAGPLHACELAAALRLPRVLVPPRPGVLSALGLLMARQRRERSLTVMLRTGQTSEAALEAVVQRLRQGEPGAVRRQVDVRYPGQSFELTLGLPRLDPARIADAFHRLHRKRYGFAHPARDVEIVNVRVSLEAPGPARGLTASITGAAARTPGTRPVFTSLGPVQAQVLWRDGLSGAVEGPAVVLQYDTTTWVPPGWRGHVDPQGNLVLEAA